MTASGWVKSTTASAPARHQYVERVARVEPGDQLGVRRGLDRAAHLRADLSQRTQHPDLQRLAHGPNLVPRPLLDGWHEPGVTDSGAG